MPMFLPHMALFAAKLKAHSLSTSAFIPRKRLLPARTYHSKPTGSLLYMRRGTTTRRTVCHNNSHNSNSLACLGLSEYRRVGVLPVTCMLAHLWSEFEAIAHDAAHHVFMTLPPYTSTREGEAPQLG